MQSGSAAAALICSESLLSAQGPLFVLGRTPPFITVVADYAHRNQGRISVIGSERGASAAFVPENGTKETPDAMEDKLQQSWASRLASLGR
jgi:hypothetical protein